MQIFGRSLAGSTLTLECSPGSSAADLCSALCAKEGIESGAVRLVLEGKQLDPASELGECGVEDGCTVHMLPRMVGGVIEPSLIVLAKKYNSEVRQQQQPASSSSRSSSQQQKQQQQSGSHLSSRAAQQQSSSRSPSL